MNHRHFILSLLQERGLSQAGLARQMKVSQPLINQALREEGNRYNRTRRAILRHLGYEVAEEIKKV